MLFMQILMSVLKDLVCAPLMLLVLTLREVITAHVTLDTMEMGSLVKVCVDVYVRVFYKALAIINLLMQILMSVLKDLMCVPLMLSVLTLREIITAHVTLDTMEMGSLVKVSVDMFYKAIIYHRCQLSGTVPDFSTLSLVPDHLLNCPGFQ